MLNSAVERTGFLRRLQEPALNSKFVHPLAQHLSKKELLDQIEFHHKKNNYGSLTHNEMDGVLHRGRVFYKIPRDARLVPPRFMLYVTKYLGKMIRVQGEGTILGQRALDEQRARSASMVCLSQCEFIILGVMDYVSLVKVKAKEHRNLKFRMIYNVFNGSESLSHENFWQLQYLFAQGTTKEGTMMAEDAVKNNRVLLIESGACEIIKLKSRRTLANFDSAVEDLEEVATRDEELMEILGELRKEIARMPEGSCYHLGFIGEGQVANLEALFSTTGSSLFSYRVRYAEIKHFEIDMSIQKVAMYKGEIQSNCLKLLKTILRHRTRMLANKNRIQDPNPTEFIVEPDIDKIVNSAYLTKKLKEDRLKPAIDFLSNPDTMEELPVGTSSDAKDVRPFKSDLRRSSSQENSLVVSVGRMGWKMKSQRAVSREASISPNFKNYLAEELEKGPRVLSSQPKKDSFANLFAGSSKPTIAKTGNLMKVLRKERSLDFANRRKFDNVTAGTSRITDMTKATERRPDTSALNFMALSGKFDKEPSTRLELSRKTSAIIVLERSDKKEPNVEATDFRSNVLAASLGFRKHHLKNLQRLGSSQRISRPLSSYLQCSNESSRRNSPGKANMAPEPKGKLSLIVKKSGFSDLAKSQLIKNNKFLRIVK